MKRITFTGIIRQENGKFTSLCPEFDVASFGHTIEEAKNKLQEAVELYLESAQGLGILSEILEEAGFVISDDIFAVNEYISTPMLAELAGV